MPIRLGRWSREIMLLLTRPQLYLLCQRIWKKCHHNLPTYLKSLPQVNVTTRFTVFQVAVINFKNRHVCVCHYHTSHLFTPTENGMVLSSSHPQVLPNTWKTNSAPCNEPNQHNNCKPPYNSDYSLGVLSRGLFVCFVGGSSSHLPPFQSQAPKDQKQAVSTKMHKQYPLAGLNTISAVRMYCSYSDDKKISI